MERCVACYNIGYVAYLRLTKIIGDNKYYQCTSCKSVKIKKED